MKDYTGKRYLISELIKQLEILPGGSYVLSIEEFQTEYEYEITIKLFVPKGVKS